MCAYLYVYILHLSLAALSKSPELLDLFVPLRDDNLSTSGVRSICTALLHSTISAVNVAICNELF